MQLGSCETWCPPGINLRVFLFIICINDLPLNINNIVDAMLFADGTSIFVTKDNYDDFKHMSDNVLSRMCKWLNVNHLVHNVEKTNIVKFTTTNLSHYPLAI